MEKINFKNLLALSAGLIIVAPTTVGILADGNTTINNKISDQTIVDEINKVTYKTMILLKPGMTVDLLKERITPEFIQKSLQGKVKTGFNKQSFKFKTFINNGRPLKDNDLDGFGLIEAEIQYDYGSIKNQITKFTINKTLPADDVNAALQSVQYQKRIKVSETNSAKEFLKQIDGKFIQENGQLDDNIKQAFVPSLFTINKITYNGNPLSDNDLRQSQKINTIVDYNYDDFGGQFTLTIIITPTDKEMVEVINKGTYELKDILIDTQANTVEKEINAVFFKKQLNDKFKDMLDITLFTRQGKIMIGDEELSDDNLKEEKTIDAKITYSYGEIKEQELNFKIKVVKIKIEPFNLSNIL